MEIIFGVGKLSCLHSSVGNCNAVVISDPYFAKIAGRDDLRKLIGSSLVSIFDVVQPNPTFSSVKTAFRNLQAFECDLIIALGGGSTIDTAKVVATVEASGTDDWIDDHLKRAALFPQPFNLKPIIACKCQVLFHSHPCWHGQGSHHVGNSMGYEGKEKIFLKPSLIISKDSLNRS